MRTLSIILDELSDRVVSPTAAKELAEAIYARLVKENAILHEALPHHSTWRGGYCEAYHDHVLVWGAAQYYGSAHSPQELWGLLQRLKTEPGSGRRTAAMPALPTDPEERERAIAEWLSQNAPTMTQRDKRKRLRAELTLDDLELEI